MFTSCGCSYLVMKKSLALPIELGLIPFSSCITIPSIYSLSSMILISGSIILLSINVALMLCKVLRLVMSLLAVRVSTRRIISFAKGTSLCISMIKSSQGWWPKPPPSTRLDGASTGTAPAVVASDLAVAEVGVVPGVAHASHVPFG